jgi:hypothetical protein
MVKEKKISLSRGLDSLFIAVLPDTPYLLPNKYPIQVGYGFTFHTVQIRI